MNGDADAHVGAIDFLHANDALHAVKEISLSAVGGDFGERGWEGCHGSLHVVIRDMGSFIDGLSIP